MPGTPHLLTKRDVAAELGVHLSTVNRMVARGELVPARTYDGPQRVALYLFSPTAVRRLKADRSKGRAA